MLRVIQHLSRYRNLSSATVVGGYSKEDYQNVSYYFIEADDEKAGIDSLGEDAFFLSKTKKKFDFYGVADGVGGWRRQGVDPSIFSSTLMRECLLATSFFEDDAKNACPRKMLSKAFETMKTTHNQSVYSQYTLLGSSTAITASIDKENNRARICNLGDSGFIHIRNGDIIERSTEQTHYFNCPYQLSIPTPGHNSITDTPDKADLYELSELQPNDILLLASDGLFDNVSDEDILSILGSSNVKSLKADMVQLAAFCLNQALDEKVLSPFALNARKEGYTTECGGKLDDLTIVINLFS